MPRDHDTDPFGPLFQRIRPAPAAWPWCSPRRCCAASSGAGVFAWQADAPVASVLALLAGLLVITRLGAPRAYARATALLVVATGFASWATRHDEASHITARPFGDAVPPAET